ncbi:MAG: STAS domain-containing protein [bacterium]
MGIKKSSINCPDKVRCFDLKGKIFHENVAELENKLEKTLGGDTEEIVLNCEELRMIDSSGISVLVDVIKKLSKRSGALHLCAMSESIRKIFKLTNLEKFIEIHPDVKSALKDIKG